MLHWSSSWSASSSFALLLWILHFLLGMLVHLYYWYYIVSTDGTCSRRMLHAYDAYERAREGERDREREGRKVVLFLTSSLCTYWQNVSRKGNPPFGVGHRNNNPPGTEIIKKYLSSWIMSHHHHRHLHHNHDTWAHCWCYSVVIFVIFCCGIFVLCFIFVFFVFFSVVFLCLCYFLCCFLLLCNFIVLFFVFFSQILQC